MIDSRQASPLLALAAVIVAAACGGGGKVAGRDGGGREDAAPPPPIKTGAVRGQIVNQAHAIGGAGVPGADAGVERVEVYVEQHPSLSTLADPAGGFLLEQVPVGVVNLIAEHRTEDGTLFRMRSDEITVEADRTTVLPAAIAVLEADQVFAGRVLNEETSEVLAGVAISVWGRTAISAADGSFMIQDLVGSAIAYQLRFEKSGFAPLTRSAKIADADARLLEVRLVPVPNTGSVKGRVSANGPLEGVSILCEQHPDIRTTTDAEGRFLLEDVPAGMVRILALAPFGESYLRGSAECTVEVGVSLELAAPISLLVHAKAVHGFIDVVGGEAGDEVGVEVTALGQSVLSNDIGYFKLEHLPPERLTLAFRKSGLVPRTVEVDLTTVATVDLSPFAMEPIPPEQIPDVEVPLRSLDSIVFGMSQAAVGEGLVRLQVQAIVRLPEKAGVTRRNLHSLTSDDSFPVDPDGFLVTNSTIGPSSPALVMVGMKDHPALEQVHPLLLKIWHPADQGFALEDQYIDSTSTAEALVLLDNVFWTLPAAEFLQVREAVRGHVSFAALVRSVELALQSPDAETLFRDALVSGAQSIAQGVAAALDLTPPERALPPTPRSLGDPNPDKVVYVEDDAERSGAQVLLTNRSYCHYTVEIRKGTLVVASPAGKNHFALPRSTHVSYTWDWPPDRKTQTPAILGAGEFDFSFYKRKDLSIFDGLMTFAGAVIGTGASTYDELSDGLTLLAATSSGLMDMINVAGTAAINSPADALKLADDMLFSGSKVGFDLVMDFAPKYFGAKLQRDIKSSWFKATAKFLLKKALIWGVAAYNTTDVALILYDVSQTPDHYAEKGWQTTAGWYGDLFAEKIGKMKNLRVIFNLPVHGTAYYEDSSVETSGDLQYEGPIVATGFTINPDPGNRMLIGASYELQESAVRHVSVEFSNLGFNGFIDRYNGNAFDETKMQFVWGAPTADLIQVTRFVHDAVTPYIPNWVDLLFWEYSSTAWESSTTGHYAGIILSE